MRSINLLLFSSRFMSLAEWDRLGMFDREVALYRRLAQMGVNIGFVTYGGADDLDYGSLLPGMTIHPNRWRLRPRQYERLLPILHGRALFRSNVLKTNQASSIYAAGPAAKIWRKPLLARMGFLSSDFAAYEQGRESSEYRKSDAFERKLFLQAQAIVVTSRTMAKNVAARVPAKSETVSVIPNYVDTELFAPHHGVNPDVDLLFVGRLVEQKNLSSLLGALEQTGASAMFVGNGPMAPLLLDAVQASGGRLRWTPSLPNRDLPQVMARAKLFVLPSLWEGHPKTLIEAMSCGKAVLGAEAPGIRDQIEHGQTGWLCGSGADELAVAIKSLLGRSDLLSHMGAAARRRILETCSLDRVVQAEYSLLARLAGIDD